MTNVLSHLSTSSSNSATQNGPLEGNSLLSTQKFPTTFIIQPPSSSQTQASMVLTKRYKPAELGDLLLKKIKTQTSNSSASNSNQASPLLKRNYEDAIYESSEGFEVQSSIEEEASPSAKSYCEERDAKNAGNENPLIPQRSLSNPVVHTSLAFWSLRGGLNDNQKQLQNALESLQRKILIDQKVASLRDMFSKIQASHQPLTIPPLLSCSGPSQSSISKKEQDDEDEPEIIYGEVEYPLLSLLATRAKTEGATINLPNSSSKRGSGKFKRSLTKLSESSSPSSGYDEENDFLLDSLTATRAGTQKSECQLVSNLKEMSKELAKITKGTKRKNNKGDSIDRLETVEKIQKKIKEPKKERNTKSRKQKKDELLTPVLIEKKVAEKKKNKL